MSSDWETDLHNDVEAAEKFVSTNSDRTANVEKHCRTRRSNTTTGDNENDVTPGLWPAKQAPADVIARVNLGDTSTPAAVWKTIATAHGFQKLITNTVRDQLEEASAGQRDCVLDDLEVTAANHGYTAVASSLARPEDDDLHQQALDITAEFGQPERSKIGWHLDLEEIEDGPLRLIELADQTPTIAVRVPPPFRGKRRDHRENVLDLLTMIGQVARVVIVANGFTTRWLAHEHRANLPAAFDERLTERRNIAPETITAARNVLTPDGRRVKILRDLQAQPGETLSYGDLAALHNVTRSTLSNHLGDLEDLDLVERFGPQSDRYVELRPTGREYLDVLDEEIGRQQTISEAFDETSNSSDDSRVQREPVGGGADGGQVDRHRCPRYHELSWLHRSEHDAVGGVAVNGGISLVDHPVEPLDDRAAPLLSYNDEREELVVGSEYDNPLSWMVSIAMGLASQVVFNNVLTADRLGDDVHEFADLLNDHRQLLRESRCLGYLADSAASPEEYIDALLKAREDLGDLTRDLANGNYDDRDEFRGTILREAHGLAGTVVHLADLVDIDIVRLARVPRFSRDFKTSDREDFAQVIANQAIIQSHYGQFAAYRQLYETREDKQPTLSPKVDAADPYGEMIGSMVLVGPGIESFQDNLEAKLRNPGELRDDAPEFAVQVSITTPDVEAYSNVATRVLERKHMEPDPKATVLLKTFVGSVYDAAMALDRLAHEGFREIRLDELRFALGHLDADRILPSAPRSVGKIVKALLTATEPLSRTELAERADVSTQSIRNHFPALSALDLVRETDAGLRIALPFTTVEERGEEIAPMAVTEKHSAAQDLVTELVYETVANREQRRQLDAALAWPPDFDGIVATAPELEPWIPVARDLTATPGKPPTTVTVGPVPQQASLDAVTEKGGG